MSTRAFVGWAASLLLAACGGLIGSSEGDGGSEPTPILHPEAGHLDAGSGTDGDSADAPGDAHREAPTDSPAHATCPLADAGPTSWTGYSIGREAGINLGINAIGGAGPDDVWAVGYDSGFGSVPAVVRGAALHWTGSDWLTTSLPVLSGGLAYVLNGVWASAADDVWAVGLSQTPPGRGPLTNADVIWHWNGSAWSISPSPPGGSGLAGVWGSGPTDVWAVGISRTVHWDGSAWSVYELSDGGSAGGSALWGSASNDVWAVGTTYAGTPLFQHWDGSAWSVIDPTPVPDGGFHKGSLLFTPVSLWGSGPADVWAAGYSCPVGVYDDYGPLCYVHAWHWNGTVWTDATPHSRVLDQLDAVWGTGPCDVWFASIGGLLFHFTGEYGKDGLVWSQQSLPTYGIEPRFYLWGSGTSDIWTGGGDGVELLHSR